MRVLQINSVCGVGSTGRIATDIHSLLIEQGRESYIAYGRNQPMNCDNPIKIGNKIDIMNHVLKTRILDMHGFGSEKATKNFIKKIKILNPDVIHLHNIHGYYLNIKTLFEFLKIFNKPIVWTLHDLWPITGHGAYLDNSHNQTGENLFKFGTNKNSYPKSILFDNSNKNYELKKKIFTGLKNLTIISPSKWLANLAKKSFLNEYPIKVINNGIDLDTFVPNKGNFREKYNLDDKFVILGVASIWDQRKGLKYFIELADKIYKDEVIVLVGLTEKQLKQIPGNVVGITKTNNLEDLVNIYSSSDVFVNPTLEDNFPTTNLEALSCGTPVITFDTGGSSESIDKYTGIKIEDKTSYQLYKAISKIRISPLCEKKCIEKSKNFDKNLKFAEYVKFYDLLGMGKI